MNNIRPFLLAGAVAALAACMSGESHEGSNPAPASPGKARATKEIVFRDADNLPVTEVLPGVLADIRTQMLRKGMTEEVKTLEATYDFNTGKLRAQAAPAAK
jgi:hypothetical protein